MLALAFFKWWYGPGWVARFTSILPLVKRTFYSYSIPQISRTIFAPWRRIITPGGGAIGERFRALIDNAVSRFIGAIVRIGTIFVAFIMMLGWVIGCTATGIIWPFLPIAGIILVIWGVI